MNWEKEPPFSIDMLACPTCHNSLTEKDETLRCEKCQLDYPIKEGIPLFFEQSEVNGVNLKFSRLYDRFSWGYKALTKIAFIFIGVTEEQARREIIDRIESDGVVF